MAIKINGATVIDDSSAFTGASLSVSGTVTAAGIDTGSSAISTTGNVTGGNVLSGGIVSATGNVTGNYIIGDGSQLTGLPAGYADSDVATYLASGTVSTAIETTSTISATGNVTGNYIIGDGSQLTGLPAGYANSDVATYLSSGTVSTDIETTAAISATGTVTGSSFSGTTAASTLTGSTLSSNVTGSSLTSVGTIGTGTWAATDIAVTHGGTGASDAGTARTNLGLAIGTDVQAYNATLAAVAGGTYTGDDSITTVGTIGTGTWAATDVAVAHGGTGASDAATARTNLGLGTIATYTAGGSNGAATLDGSGTLTAAQIPASLIGAVVYEGTWNASTNTPTLTSATGTQGHYYVVSTAGSTNLDGTTDWKVGDWAIYSGTAWQKIDNTADVTSVAGKTGAVTLVKGDVGLGSVENTAISTYAGTTSTTTVGTIGTGTWAATDIAVAHGGTGASDAATARTNLGLAIGTNVQAYNATLAAVAASTYTGDNAITTVGTISSGTWAATDIAVAHGGTGASDAATALTNLGAYPASNPSGYVSSSGVTSVSGTAPVVSSGGATPAISMPAATASVNGYMTSTFASKLNGIATGATNVTNNNQLTNGAGYVTSAGSVASATTATNATNVQVDDDNGTNATRYITFVDNSTAGNKRLNEDSTLTYNPATNTLSATIFSGTATNARYADLAEKYEADAEYTPGTVVSFGGDAEVTSSTDADTRVAGVVSTNPAYTMNNDLVADHVVTVAFTGRVPCRVIGTVRKGDLMVSAGNGLARAEANPAPGTIIGKALATHDGAEGVIEVVVGRF